MPAQPPHASAAATTFQAHPSRHRPSTITDITDITADIAAAVASVDAGSPPASEDPDSLVCVRARDLNDLLRKLQSQPVIEEAKGVLMGYYGLDAETAFEVLRRWSQTSNIKLRDLAHYLIQAVSEHSCREIPPHDLIQQWTTQPAPARQLE